MQLDSAARMWIERRNREVASFLDLRMEATFGAWVLAVVLIGFIKTLQAPLPPHSAVEACVMQLPFFLIALSPIAGYRLACAYFPRDRSVAQPGIRFSFYGAWRPLANDVARSHPSFGPGGFLVSLIAGLLLNVPFRSVEFLLAIPAIGNLSPDWARLMLRMMTFDVVVMNFTYVLCAVMALRSCPLFPRMLLFAWSLDIFLQLTIARTIGAATDLPAPVAHALAPLLQGNIKKVLISAAIWLPYLILSERVNITFRNRERI